MNLEILTTRIINNVTYKDIVINNTKLTISELGAIYYYKTFKEYPKTYGEGHYKGYLAIEIEGSKILLHRIIGATFLGYEKGYSYNHKDHNKKNNAVSNLEKVKSSEHIKEHCKKWDIPRSKYAPLYAHSLKDHNFRCNHFH